jgi:hypothetical protein
MTRRDMFSWLIGKKKKAAESKPMQVIPLPEPAPQVETAPPLNVNGGVDAPTASMAPTSAQPARTGSDLTPRLLVVLAKPAGPPIPAAGMSVTVRSGGKTRPASIDAVCANGRRLFVTTAGTEFRRAYTKRRNGRYHLEGAPDIAGPTLEFAEPNTGKTTAPSSNQPCRPLRYVNRRLSPGLSVLQAGRRPKSDRDKADARGQGSATGRRPVINGPIKTPRRSKARSRMPRASRCAQVLTR